MIIQQVIKFSIFLCLKQIDRNNKEKKITVNQMCTAHKYILTLLELREWILQKTDKGMKAKLNL